MLLDLPEKSQLMTIVTKNVQKSNENNVPVLSNIVLNINQSTRVSVPVLSSIATNVNSSEERNKSNTLCGIAARTARAVSINNPHSDKAELLLDQKVLCRFFLFLIKIFFYNFYYLH